MTRQRSPAWRARPDARQGGRGERREPPATSLDRDPGERNGHQDAAGSGEREEQPEPAGQPRSPLRRGPEARHREQQEERFRIGRREDEAEGEEERVEHGPRRRLLVGEVPGEPPEEPQPEEQGAVRDHQRRDVPGTLAVPGKDRVERPHRPRVEGKEGHVRLHRGERPTKLVPARRDVQVPVRVPAPEGVEPGRRHEGPPPPGRLRRRVGPADRHLVAEPGHPCEEQARPDEGQQHGAEEHRVLLHRPRRS